MFMHGGLYMGQKDRLYSWCNLSFSGSNEITVGVGIDLQWQGDEGVLSANRIGAGAGSGKSDEANLAILPLLSSYKVLRETLFGMRESAI